MTTLPKKLFPFFLHFLRKQPVAFTIFFLVPTLNVMETTVQPYALKMIIDTITGYQGDRGVIFSVIAPALFLYGGSWLVMVIAIRLQNWWQAYVIPKFQADIRSSVLNYLSAHSYHYFANQLSGSLANKVADLPRALESIRMILCWNVVSSIAVAGVSLVMVATISPLSTIILGAWMAVHLVVVLFFSRSTNQISAENAEDKSVLSGSIVDMLTNMVSMLSFARRRYELSRIEGLQEKEIDSNKRVILQMNIMRLWMDVAVTLMMGALLYSLILGWQKALISAGDMVFIVYGSAGVMYQFWFLGHALGDLFKEVGIAQQALTVITPPHEVIDKSQALPLRVQHGEIVFDQVTFHYSRGNNLFENKSVTLKAGTKVGLVGFSGSGKTTFVHLIMRFFDVHGGRILIDGHNIADVMQDSLHQAIALIPQDTSLFHRTLMDNIRYGKLDATDEEVIEAAKKAHCHEFITQLQEGYNTLVGERGIKLSGGQRQRIAIARAMLKDAPILILDEATSALDSVTEKLIQEGLQSLMQQRTTIVIAHRLSTLAEMDRILVFDKGHIIEDGTHHFLLAAQGHYARMWHMQAGGFLPERENE